MLGSCCKINDADAGIEFHFSLCDEVDHMMDTEYLKPLEFMDISNQRMAEQLTWKDAVSLMDFQRDQAPSLHNCVLTMPPLPKYTKLVTADIY